MNVEHTHKKERSIVLILQYPFYSSQTWIKTNLLIFLNFKINKLTIGDLPLLDECRREELRRRSWHFLLPLFNKISPDYLKNNKTKKKSKTPNTCGGIDWVANQQRTKDKNVFKSNPKMLCFVWNWDV